MPSIVTKSIAALGLAAFALPVWAQFGPGTPTTSISNGVLEVGVSSSYGGAITWLSLAGANRNLINNHDKGRQIQQSYYAGLETDRLAEGQRPNWSPWPWNPVQAGDSYNNPSLMLDETTDGEEIYIRVQPLLWDMNNELAEAHFESWIRLEGNIVKVRNRLTCFRTDDFWDVVPRHQELPAVITIGALSTLYTYDGDSPFTRAPLTIIPPVTGGGFPWSYWGAGEKWAAHVDENLWGIGVYYADTEEFIGGFFGTPPGETADNPTGYISPLRTIALDKDTVFEYEFDLIVGTLNEIRAHAYASEGHTYELDPDNTEFPPSPSGVPVAGGAGLGLLVAMLSFRLFRGQARR